MATIRSRTGVRTARVPRGAEKAFALLQHLPNVGVATAEDLVRLGVRSVADLKRRDPMKMYDAICALDGRPHDPCVIDVFMAVVDYAKTGKSKPWWAFTATRKQLLGPSSRAPQIKKKAARRRSKAKTPRATSAERVHRSPR